MLPAALVVLALLAAAPAANASALAVQQDCADSDVFEGKHSRQSLEAALDEIQADLAEYGTCKQMILAALAAMDKRAKGSKNSGGGADLDGDGVVTPEERATAAKRAKAKKKQQAKQLAAVSDDLVQDDTAALTSDGDSGGGSSLPLILIVLALICAGAGGGLWYASKRNPAVANALRRVPLPFRNS
jgi:hypothetical protein